MNCKTSSRKFDGQTVRGSATDYVEVIASDSCEIGIIVSSGWNEQQAYFTPQAIRELATHLIKLANEIEGRIPGHPIKFKK